MEPSEAQGILYDAIHDHAQRRVSISYLQLLAYWKEGCSVQGAKTLHQHGASNCSNCNAAHSALLPNIGDNFRESLIQRIHRCGVDAYTEKAVACIWSFQ